MHIDFCPDTEIQIATATIYMYTVRLFYNNKYTKGHMFL